MNKYILIAPSFEGFLVYGFNRQNYLVEFRNCSWSMTPQQIEGVLRHLGYTLTAQMFGDWARTHGYEIRKVKEELSYDIFQKHYDMARDRHIAEPIWNKLSAEEQTYTLHNVEAYKRYLERHDWMSQMMPKTYLKNHRRDDWDKINHTKNSK